MKYSTTLHRLSLALVMGGILMTVPTIIPSTTSVAFAHQHAHAISPSVVLGTYAEQAYTLYADSLKDAKALQTALQAFTQTPTEATLNTAKKAWLQSRESYGLTEPFRLSNGPIDAEEGWVADAYGSLESQINAWPLDEVMIDYTIDADGKRTSGNIIDSTGKFTPTGEEAKAVNIDTITPEVLTDLNENGGEANVATGYHAIEFLLWGQDQDYNSFVADTITHGPTTAGQRPLSDYTSDQFANRRKAYLNAAAEKLVADLTTITQAWAPERDTKDTNTGLYRAALLGQLKGAEADKNISPKEALRQIIAGLGVFMKSELANERVAVAVLTPSEEDEHSCFSDNTHRDIAQNFQGFVDILKGEMNGKKIGPALWDGLSNTDKATISKLIDDIQSRIQKINTLASSQMHFDYQIKPEHEKESRNIVSMKNQMRRLGDQMITVGKAFDINLSEEDVTDSEETKIEG
ncbi:imelysin [Pelistega sp. NLN82]|uniref:Imelysin n=1 Tax=Pelistega ratti TaxID=2652177 RepID=A0A6L9Y4X5_9BURK|nr:imelysin family protein [Pelistega ratti]NEN75510.1 imelysin [Pelistega ratti]